VAWPLAAGTLRPLLDEELAIFDFIFAEKDQAPFRSFARRTLAFFRPPLAGAPLEQGALSGKTFAHYVEECAHARGAPEVGVSNNPQLARELRHWSRQGSGEPGIEIAQITGSTARPMPARAAAS
jgi:hypothetical protein